MSHTFHGEHIQSMDSLHAKEIYKDSWIKSKSRVTRTHYRNIKLSTLSSISRHLSSVIRSADSRLAVSMTRRLRAMSASMSANNWSVLAQLLFTMSTILPVSPVSWGSGVRGCQNSGTSVIGREFAWSFLKAINVYNGMPQTIYFAGYESD